ncbi:MAG: hypothetical protein NVS3B5_02150 [Sphingomicrobium sp.]
MWDVDLVRERFIEAVDIERRVVVKGAPRVGNGWPQYKFDQEDRAGWDDAAKQDDLERWQGRKFTTSAEQSRWQEVVFEWRLLIPVDRRDLVWDFAECRARGWSFSKYCEDNGLVRMTAYNRINRVLEDLAARFSKEGRLLRFSASKSTLQEGTNSIGLDATVEIYASAKRPAKHPPFRTELVRDLLKTPADIAAFSQHLVDTNDERRRLHERRIKKAMRGVPGEQHAT